MVANIKFAVIINGSNFIFPASFASVWFLLCRELLSQATPVPNYIIIYKYLS